MFPRRLTLVLLLIALSTGCSSTEDVPASDVTSPVVDGRLDDACWTTALHLTGFTRPGSDESPAQPIEAWVTRDETTLYVAARCAVADVTKIKADITVENDGVWQDDAVEVFVRTGTDFLDYDQFIVNSISTRGW
ncbi:MAG TPA: sugar-binding protein, partial [Planctomycetota bacterium]|nr:sugar-binding protein [Planctomycetota bacterium]